MTFFQGIKSIFTPDPKGEQRSGEVCVPAGSSLGLLDLMVNGATKAKVPVNVNSVLGVSAVLRAITIIAEGLAALDFNLYEEDDKVMLPAKSHPLYNLITREPHPRTSKFMFIRTLVTNAIMHGNGYAIILRNAFDGRPTGFLVLNSKDVTIYEDNNTGEVVYVVTSNLVDRKAQGFLPRDIIHITTLSMGGITGENIIRKNAENLAISIASTDYAAAFFGNRAHVPGYIKHPGQLSREAVIKIMEGWQRNSGAANAHKVNMLDEGMEFKPLGLNPGEAMLIENRKFQVEEISRIIGVPLHMLNAMDRATFNNVEAMDIGFVKYHLRPWAVQIEEEFDRKIFTPSEKAAGRLFVQFNLNSLLRGDLKSRSEFFRTMFEIGAYSPNDIRRIENENPREGGDKYFTPLNFTTNPDKAETDGTE